MTYHTPTAWWTLNETSGTRTDNVGSIALTPGVDHYTTDGIKGNAWRASASDCYLAGTLPTNKFPSVGWAVSCWFRVENLTDTLFMFRVAGAGAALYANYYGSTNQLELGYTDGGGLSRNTYLGCSPQVNTWHHLVYGRDGSGTGVGWAWIASSDDGGNHVYQEFTTGSDPKQGSGYTVTLGLGGAGSGRRVDLDEVGFWKDPTFGTLSKRKAFCQHLYNNGTGTFWNGSAWS
jgi:hypothetical protein